MPGGGGPCRAAWARAPCRCGWPVRRSLLVVWGRCRADRTGAVCQALATVTVTPRTLRPGRLTPARVLPIAAGRALAAWCRWRGQPATGRRERGRSVEGARRRAALAHRAAGPGSGSWRRWLRHKLSGGSRHSHLSARLPGRRRSGPLAADAEGRRGHTGRADDAARQSGGWPGVRGWRRGSGAS